MVAPKATSAYAPSSLRAPIEALLPRLGIHRGYDDVPALGKAVATLSASYNTAGVAAGKAHYAARLAFSLPRDVPKAAHAVRELVAAKALTFPDGRPLRILDVGAGFGATTLGALQALEGAALGEGRGKVEVTLVDPEEGATALAKTFLEGLKGSFDLKVVVSKHGISPDGSIQPDLLPWFGDEPFGFAEASAKAHPERAESMRAAGKPSTFRPVKEGQGFDLVLFGQVLSELDRGLDSDARIARHVALLERVLATRLAPKGTLVVVEPALKERTRHLHAVRDRLCTNESVTLFGPCLHREACPALAKETDWCHEDRPDVLPAWLVPVARAAGLRWEGVTFSPLLLRKDGVTLRSTLATNGNRTLRVVGDVTPTKGKVEAQVCGDGPEGEGPQRVRVMRIDRDRRENNEAFDELSRGDLVVLEGPMVRPDRIGPETTVSRANPV